MSKHVTKSEQIFCYSSGPSIKTVSQSIPKMLTAVKQQQNRTSTMLPAHDLAMQTTLGIIANRYMYIYIRVYTYCMSIV